MKLNADHIRDRFCVAGISYRKADAQMRGLFAIDAEMHRQLLSQAAQQGINSVFVLSTCNRTEIYGYVSHPAVLAALLTKFTKGSFDDFMTNGFVQYGRSAMHHLFSVASGLDSQIIGDYEIQGQLKKAVALARAEGLIGTIMDRTINFVFQASKKIRASTGLSSGTVSVSYAAIEWLQRKLGDRKHKALVIGTGKFGANVCRNLLEYMPQCELTICNRTPEKAFALMKELQVNSIPFATLDQHLDDYDVVIASTAAQEPVVLRRHFKTERERFIVDLSIPANVEKQVGALPGVQLANVDDISLILEQNIERRKSEVPKAAAIIEAFENEFYAWLHTYKHTPAIRRIKQDLMEIGKMRLVAGEIADEDLLSHADLQELVQQTVHGLMMNLKQSTEKGCYFIEAYHHFLKHPALASQPI